MNELKPQTKARYAHNPYKCHCSSPVKALFVNKQYIFGYCHFGTLQKKNAKTHTNPRHFRAFNVSRCKSGVRGRAACRDTLDQTAPSTAHATKFKQNQHTSKCHPHRSPNCHAMTECATPDTRKIAKARTSLWGRVPGRNPKAFSAMHLPKLLYGSTTSRCQNFPQNPRRLEASRKWPKIGGHCCGLSKRRMRTRRIDRPAWAASSMAYATQAQKTANVARRVVSRIVIGCMSENIRRMYICRTSSKSLGWNGMNAPGITMGWMKWRSTQYTVSLVILAIAN